MKYLLATLSILVVWFLAWCLCRAARENEYPDYIEDPYSEDCE